LLVLYIPKPKTKVQFVTSTFAVSLPFSILAGARFGVGKDFFAYLDIYENIRVLSFHELIEQKAPLFAVINWIIGIFDAPNSFLLFFILSLLFVWTTILVLYSFLEKKEILLGVFIIFSLVYIESYNLVRQFVSIGLVTIAYRTLFLKDKAKYVLLIIIASLIHLTSIVMIIGMFLDFRKKYKKLLDLVFYTFLIISPILIPLLISAVKIIPIFSGYFRFYQFNFEGFGLGFLIEILPVIFVVLFFNKVLTTYDSRYDILFKILLLTIPFRFLSYYFEWGSRMMLYTIVLQAIIVPKGITISRHKYLKLILFIIIYVSIFIYQYIVRNMGPAYPYNFI
jgi:hypothetical protein